MLFVRRVLWVLTVVVRGSFVRRASSRGSPRELGDPVVMDSMGRMAIARAGTLGWAREYSAPGRRGPRHRRIGVRWVMPSCLLEKGRWLPAAPS